MILVVDEAVGRHLAAALKAHIRELRRDGVPVPSSLADLASVCATGGQQRPAFDNPRDTGDHPGMDQLAVDYRDAAARLGISDRSVRRLVAEGTLPAVEVAGCARIRVKDLAEYVDGLPARGKATA